MAGEEGLGAELAEGVGDDGAGRLRREASAPELPSQVDSELEDVFLGAVGPEARAAGVRAGFEEEDRPVLEAGGAVGLDLSSEAGRDLLVGVQTSDPAGDLGVAPEAQRQRRDRPPAKGRSPVARSEGNSPSSAANDSAYVWRSTVAARPG